jgi:carbon-monoxide dehydrogenase large subunit
MTDDGIGARTRRKEDQRFLTGKGRYTDDINRPGQACAAFVRSPHAHARIRKIDTGAAAGMPGVLGVFTGDDVAKAGLGGLICGWMIHSKDGSPMKAPAHPALAQGKVRYVGDHVALVVAETAAQARDAAEAVAVDYEVLPANVDTARADADGTPQIHDDVPGNTSFDWELGDKAATEAAFKSAKHVAKLDLVNNRLIPNAIEPRSAVGEYDPAADAFTLHVTSQNPHVARLVLSAFIQIAPEHKLRVVAPDVGGGFGSKIFIYPEEVVVTWAAKQVGRPVKWTAERSESFLADAHGRDHVTHAELALDDGGKFLGLRVSTRAGMGAYLSTFASCVPTYLYATLLAGQYTTPAIYCEVKAVFTNTAPVDAYRGAGRPEATYLLERIIDVAARETGIDPAELRRRNFIADDAFPYQTPVIMTYDSGQYGKALDAALDKADYKGFPARRAEAGKRGRLRGIGISSYIEACGIAPSAAVGSLGAGVGLWEGAQVRFNPTGSVTVFTGSHAHGQGHETTFAQIIADKLGVPFASVEVVHGDTDKGPFGMGTYGSRSLAVGGSAIVTACDKIIEKGRKIAAHLLEASESDIEYAGGVFKVAGTDRQKTMGEIAFAAYVPHNYPAGLEPALDETGYYDPPNFTFPSGTQICEVEVDPDTGVVEVVKFTAIDDVGNVVNPMIVEGQIHGGVTQGIGQALIENCVYDPATGQLVTGTYNDYAMPRADDVPSYDIGMIETPCPHNPLGVKGCGEVGAIAAPPAVMNAVANALDVSHIEMPATPMRVWQALSRAKAA